MTVIIVTGCAPSLCSLPCKLHQCDARCVATRQYISDTIRDQHLLASFKSQSAVFLSTLYSIVLCICLNDLECQSPQGQYMSVQHAQVHPRKVRHWTGMSRQCIKSGLLVFGSMRNKRSHNALS